MRACVSTPCSARLGSARLSLVVLSIIKLRMLERQEGMGGKLAGEKKVFSHVVRTGKGVRIYVPRSVRIWMDRWMERVT